MLKVAQLALRQARASNVNLVVSRGMALEGAKGFSDKEAAIENLYFTQEDQRLMSKLLAKVKQQSEIADQHSAAGVAHAEKSALKHIVAKYNVADADLEKLMKWKHTSY